MANQNHSARFTNPVQNLAQSVIIIDITGV